MDSTRRPSARLYNTFPTIPDVEYGRVDCQKSCMSAGFIAANTAICAIFIAICAFYSIPEPAYMVALITTCGINIIVTVASWALCCIEMVRVLVLWHIVLAIIRVCGVIGCMIIIMIGVVDSTSRTVYALYLIVQMIVIVLEMIYIGHLYIVYGAGMAPDDGRG